jgi:hypothetical protein
MSDGHWLRCLPHEACKRLASNDVPCSSLVDGEALVRHAIVVAMAAACITMKGRGPLPLKKAAKACAMGSPGQ